MSLALAALLTLLLLLSAYQAGGHAAQARRDFEAAGVPPWAAWAAVTLFFVLAGALSALAVLWVSRA